MLSIFLKLLLHYFRLFARGRTDTGYPTSSASRKWVESMDDSRCDNDQRKDLLRKAIKKLAEFRLQATAGYGCDRHLLGLQCAANELGIDIPAIFTDKVPELFFYQ